MTKLKLSLTEVRKIAQEVMDNRFSRNDYHASHLKNIKAAIVDGILEVLDKQEAKQGAKDGEA